MPSCPACGRPVAVARAACLYCGGELGNRAPPDRSEATTPVPARESWPGLLVLLDVAETTPAALAEALAISPYEAALLARRGGLHLVRSAAAATATAEAERLLARGLRPWLVPEAEVRAQPLRCLGGERRADALVLRTTQDSVTLGRGEAFLVVRGPIARQYQTTPDPRRIATARLEEGFCVHIHRRAEPLALEIDALDFEPGFAVSGSARLEIEAWLEAVVGGVPRDDAFSRLPPVLGPAAPNPHGRLAAIGSLAAATRGAGTEGRPLLLDNRAQFRFYSACLAAVARRRESTALPSP